MPEATTIAVFLIVFREALEASLLVGIVLTVLARLNQKRYFPLVYLSSLAGIAASIAAGFTLLFLLGQAGEKYQERLEGVISIAACGVLTYMFFWMERQARKIRPEIEAQIESAVSRGELTAIASLTFLSILREGAETVLFLNAAAKESSFWVSFSGCFLGLSSAILVVYLIFACGKRLPLKGLFRWSGALLLIIAAGLLTTGIHELQEVKLLPEIYAPVWDLNPLLNEKKGIGSFLKALFGYNGNPSLLEVLAYIFYFTGVLSLFFRKEGDRVSVKSVSSGVAAGKS